MTFKEEYAPYVSGEAFSNGEVFTLSEGPGKSEDRIELLVEMAGGKNVIHFGCADHVPLIQKKLSSGKWLQDRLKKVAKNCVGLDNNAEAVSYIKDILGRDDCILFDVSNDDHPAELSDKTWDFVLMGEILEHVDNPVAFLEAMASRFNGLARDLVVTVPNCFSWENIYYSVRNKEFINTDHRFWFSPYTIAKIAQQAGLELVDIKMCGSTAGRSRLYRYLTDKKPMLRETIVATIRITK